MSKITIIIPVYNVEKYLKQALDSVVNQTLKDIEIICIDDCSTDGSLAILKEYAEQDSRIRLFEHKENKGVGVARNLGIDNATGEYIMFLDPDDWYELDACEVCYNQISKNQNDLVIFGFNRYIDSTGEFQYNIRDMIKPFDKYLNIPNIKLGNVDTNFINSCFIWTSIYKKSFIDKYRIKFQNHRTFEDQPFYINTMINADTISVIDKALYNYRIRKTSTTFVYTNQYNDLLNVKKNIINILNQSNKLGNFKIAVYWHTVNSSLYWFDFYKKNFRKNERLLYNNVRKILCSLDKNYIEKEVRPRLSKKTYKQYKKILKQSWFVYHNKQLLKNIFSMNNYDAHKIITILGLKFKFRRDIRLFSLRFFSYLTAWIFPLKEDRRRYRRFCYEIDERRYILQAHKNYPKILKRIKKKKEPIKILFLVNDIAKWKAQSLYDLLSRFENFEPVIALTIADIQWQNTKEERKEILKQNKIYFEQRGMNCILAYDIENDEPLELKQFEPDIVFYQQPWELHKIQHPKKIAKYALPFYIPYYVNNYTCIPIDYNQNFHKYLFRHYVLNKEWESEYKKLSGRKNIIGLGHTELDNIYLNKDFVTKNNYVLYAPHWSFSLKENFYSTFLKNRYEILEFAKNHPEINWVFKPHPRLKYALIDIGETKEQIESYWDEWRKIGIVCEDSDYMKLFLDSKALITDCGSFLTEYFCTGKPLIHLISSDCKIEPNWIAKKNFDTFYKVHNLDEMYKTFEKVIIKGEDDKKEYRQRVLQESGLLNNYAAKNILADILGEIYGKMEEDKKIYR